METSRLILRELRDADAAALSRELAHFDISRNTSSIPFPYTFADAVRFIAQQKSKPTASIKKIVALKAKPDDLIGSVRLHINTTTKSCELGYWIAKPYWGNGYATEAAACMIEHAFAVLKFPKVIADYNTDNPASGRVLEQLGFSKTGNSEDYSLAQRMLVPITLMTLTKNQWSARNTNS